MRRWMPSSLFPHICLLCDQVCAPGSTADLCGHCEITLPWNDCHCRCCAVPLEASQSKGECLDCAAEPPPFARCVVPLRYENEPRQWIRRMKFRHGLVEARLLGSLLAGAVLDAYTGEELPDVIVPVPLSSRRLARRGHNQAVSLAVVVGNCVSRPVERRRTTRILHSAPQRTLSRPARKQNLAGTFASRPWRGERVAIIDDVMTTGATITALTRTLLAAGAGEVHAWCATRTAVAR